MKNKWSNFKTIPSDDGDPTYYLNNNQVIIENGVFKPTSPSLEEFFVSLVETLFGKGVREKVENKEYNLIVRNCLIIN